jgi:hypothetical protein
MFLAAAGYFLFTTYFGLRLPHDATVAGRDARGLVSLLYLLVLVPSALWLPLTVALVDAPSAPLWWAVRLDLALVGLASLGLLACVMLAHPSAPGRRAALLGAIPFAVQTALLDATIWPLYFPSP